VPTDPEATGPNYLPPGRYTILDTGLWCEPALVSYGNTFTSFGPAQWVC
jgi:hypothetical protein